MSRTVWFVKRKEAIYIKYGDLGKRVLAFIIDGILLSMIGFLLTFTLFYAGAVCALILPVLYYVLLEGGLWHATLGKRMMALYVADAYGNGISYSTAFLRYIGKMLSGLVCGIGYLIGFFNNEKQCLHDMIAKTYVLEGQPAGTGRLSGGASRSLVCVRGALAGTVYAVTENGLLIGRDSISCQVVLPSSQSKVSRIHCYVTYNPISGMYVLNDRGSTYGTYLSNGRKIDYAQPAALKPGDRFYLATPENMFEVR